MSRFQDKISRKTPDEENSAIRNPQSEMGTFRNPQSDLLRILILEDIPTDAELIERALGDAGIAFTSTRVDTRDAFLKELKDFSPDIILSDYSMPQFNGMEALMLVKERFPSIPVIIVTGSMNEETAVDCMKSGAVDYVIKEHLRRLVPAVKGALETKKLREKKEKAEKTLRASETKYQDLYDNAPDMFISVDAKTGKIIECNRTTAKALGYKKEEIIGRRPSEIYHPDCKEESEKVAKQFVETGEVRNADLQLERKDGSKIDVSLNISTMRNEQGEVLYSRSVLRDVTVIKKLEAQLRQSQKMEAVGTLAGGVAHDFNNLLTIIIGNADLALTGVGIDNPLYGKMEEIRKAGMRAASLTRQLLAFSRKQVIQPEVLSLNEILTVLEKLLRRLIGENIDFVTIHAPALWRVEMDPGQIEQVIMNLAVNARDAMPHGGTLTIETANVDLDEAYFQGHGVENTPGPYAMISVSDNGMGMDEEIRSHIFDPFFTTKEMDRGTGLGLSTVYGIVKQNGGYVWVYSEPGKGTIFKVFIPKSDADGVPVKKDKSPEDLPKGSETILIVEDDDMVRNMVLRILLRSGYRVLEARNGEDALRVSRAHKGPIPLMLTDVVMPGMNGRELAERLQSLRPEIKVLYMSGYTDDAVVHYGVLATELKFIQKPFSLASLAGKVREVLDD